MKNLVLHTGQYRRYGDSYDIWAVYSDKATEEEVTKECESFFGLTGLPKVDNVDAWTGSDAKDMSDYFQGCWSLHKIPSGYQRDLLDAGYNYILTRFRPYDD